MESIEHRENESKKRGRPRSEKSRRAVLDTTLRLLEKSGSGNAVTMEAIAHAAGVGKQTLYKWWGSTADIYLEILEEIAEKEIDVSGQPPEKMLECFLARTFEALKLSVRIILRALMAEALIDRKFRVKFMQQLVAVRREKLVKALEQSCGLIIDDRNLAMDFIFGLMWYRLLLDVGVLDDTEGINIAKALQKPK